MYEIVFVTLSPGSVICFYLPYFSWNIEAGLWRPQKCVIYWNSMKPRKSTKTTRNLKLCLVFIKCCHPRAQNLDTFIRHATELWAVPTISARGLPMRLKSQCCLLIIREFPSSASPSTAHTLLVSRYSGCHFHHCPSQNEVLYSFLVKYATIILFACDLPRDICVFLNPLKKGDMFCEIHECLYKKSKTLFAQRFGWLDKRRKVVRQFNTTVPRSVYFFQK